jgi:hypothetical protein
MNPDFLNFCENFFRSRVMFFKINSEKNVPLPMDRDIAVDEIRGMFPNVPVAVFYEIYGDVFKKPSRRTMKIVKELAN